MDTMITRTRADLFEASDQARDAGATTTQMLHTIARMLTAPAASPVECEDHVASVLDTAANHFDELSGEHELKTGTTPYPHETATFDDLLGDDQQSVIRHVINFYGELDRPTEPPAPIALAEHLLDGLRKATALRGEYGDTFTEVYSRVRTTLFALLRTQSISSDLATESIDHALESGKSLAEAVAYVDGQL
ncbi:hypothetical protein ACQP25_16825 [Microtetraspora malaysiensis]|uniref:hypothetical protein n=1 Tax=Microtetraspora malaysiensis TaxID=161358 RepID=UPI003D8DBBA6